MIIDINCEKKSLKIIANFGRIWLEQLEKKQIIDRKSQKNIEKWMKIDINQKIIVKNHRKFIQRKRVKFT